MRPLLKFRMTGISVMKESTNGTKRGDPMTHLYLHSRQCAIPIIRRTSTESRINPTQWKLIFGISRRATNCINSFRMSWCAYLNLILWRPTASIGAQQLPVSRDLPTVRIVSNCCPTENCGTVVMMELNGAGRNAISWDMPAARVIM